MDFDFFMEPADHSDPIFLGTGTLETGKAIADALETLWQGWVSESWLVEFNIEATNLMEKYEGCNIVAERQEGNKYIEYIYTDKWELHPGI